MIDVDAILIFQHLAKTAGATLGDVFLRSFRPEEQLSIQPGSAVSALGTWLMEDVRKAIDARGARALTGVRFMGGHLGFGVHLLLPRPAKYVTLLRDPVDRVISGFYYSIPRHQAATGETVTFEEYVFRKRHYDLGLNNYQTRVISGLPDLDPTGPITTENARPITDTDFARVQRNLDTHYLLVGLTEQFDEFLVVICRLLGWTLADAVYQRTNITPSRPTRDQIPTHIIAEIEKHNSFDRQLHTLARERFAAIVKAYGDSFEENFRLFRRINSHSAAANNL